MREIGKYRGQRKDNGETVKGWYHETPLRSWISWWREEDCLPGYEQVEVIRETVGQCIGKEDKNGKEMFGGDVCLFLIGTSKAKYLEANGSLDGALVVIEKQHCAWGFRPLHPELLHENDKEWSAFWDNEDEAEWESEYFEVIGHEEKP